MGHHGSGTLPAGTRAMALAAAAVLGAAALTGCGASSGADETTVRVGTGGNIFDLPLQVAEANGYFRDQGLHVRLATLTAATATPALESGSVQFLNASPTGFLAALGKKAPETAIAADGLGNPLGLVVGNRFAEEHGLTAGTPSSVVAKALAHSTAGASSANTKAEAGIFLRAHGVDPFRLKWVSLAGPAADRAALKDHRIDWFATSEPIPLEIQHSGEGIVVADPQNVPQWSAGQAGYGQLLVARRSYAAGHSGTARRFVAAVQQATAFLARHPHDKAATAAARKALPGVPDEVLRESLEQVEWPRSGAMSISGWATTLDFVNQITALPEETLVSAEDWTNQYLP